MTRGTDADAIAGGDAGTAGAAGREAPSDDPRH